jgi:hypothetical protein
MNKITLNEWEIFSQNAFDHEGICRCCGMTHPTQKCHKLCKLHQCQEEFLSSPNGNVYHQFKSCPNKMICERCGKGGHLKETCVVSQCHFCGEIGHIQPYCQKYASFMAWQQMMSYNIHNFQQIQFAENQQIKKIDRTGYPRHWRYNPYSWTNPIVELK